MVFRAWTTSSLHGDGERPSPPDRAVQGAAAIYATRQDALRALRFAITREYAQELADLDREIEFEASKIKMEE